MIVTKKSLPRRTVLRGLGATIALPLLDGMVPAFAAAPEPVLRFGATYVGMGMTMAHWTPPKEGALDITRILSPVERFKDRLLVVGGLDSLPARASDGGVHPRSQTSWITGVEAHRTEGPDTRAGMSLDQIIAKEVGGQTQLPSLELALETGWAGSCALGYSCVYANTLAWQTPTLPLPMETNPRMVFERMFGASDSTDPKVRLADIQSDKSVLDSVLDKVSHLHQRVGSGDRAKVSQYLDSVRAVERRDPVGRGASRSRAPGRRPTPGYPRHVRRARPAHVRSARPGVPDRSHAGVDIPDGAGAQHQGVPGNRLS